MDNYGFNDSQAFVAKISSTLKRVYLKMTGALLVTAFVALWAGNSPAYWQFIAQNSWSMWALIIAEFGIVIGISAGINKLSSAAATALFYIFAIVNALTIAPIFRIYTDGSIATTFFITAGTFAAMSIFGYTTKQDLTKFGSILIMCLFGLIIATLVNLFLKSEGLYWITSFAGVIIFVGLTAWDTQQIKRMAMMAPDDSVGKLATLGALNLYLDFINLFLYLLRFFGDSRD